jgi:hypothetical protein
MALEANCTPEEVHRALMRCLATQGQSAAVAAAFLRCRAMLSRHFGTVPSPLTEQIYHDACSRAPGSSVRGAPRRTIGGAPACAALQ